MAATTKKVLVALLVIIVAIGGFVAGLILLRQRQELREEAAVPTGQANVSITPTSGDFKKGDTIKASVLFNTANIAVSGVAIRLTYQYSGTSPEVSASQIEVSPTLLSSGDWSCPTKNVTEQGGNVNIDIACANTSAAGFSTNTDTLFANVNLTVDRVPGVSPLIVRFDPTQSIITQKSNGQDILLIPSTSGSYTFGGVVTSPAPTTRLTGTPTPAAGTPTPTSTVSATPTKKPTATPSGLPAAGISTPTFVGLAVGVLLILGSLMLAF